MLGGDVKEFSSRQEVMDNQVQKYVKRGYRIESVSGWNAVMLRGRKTNTPLHMILLIVTLGLWLPLWVLIAMKNKHQRVNVYVDYYMGINVSKLR